MPDLISREVVEFLLHCHHPVRISKCIFNPVWLNRRHKIIMFTKMRNSRMSGYPFECHQGCSRRGGLVELLGGLLGEVVFDPESLVHPPSLAQLHLPFDQCHHLEVAHCLEFYRLILELVPHLVLMERLVWRMKVDLEFV
jgi:hypothetical protein